SLAAHAGHRRSKKGATRKVSPAQQKAWEKAWKKGARQLAALDAAQPHTLQQAESAFKAYTAAHKAYKAQYSDSRYLAAQRLFVDGIKRYGDKWEKVCKKLRGKGAKAVFRQDFGASLETTGHAGRIAAHKRGTKTEPGGHVGYNYMTWQLIAREGMQKNYPEIFARGKGTFTNQFGRREQFKQNAKGWWYVRSLDPVSAAEAQDTHRRVTADWTD
ncbi:MAG: hypothetical protein ACHREM_06500, partial [Polyangiales bacterium]